MQNSDILSIVTQIKSACTSVYKCLKDYQNIQKNTFNESGDQQTSLDIKANEIFITSLKDTKIKYLASEETQDIISVNKEGKYIVVFDPLDGSGNIDVELSLGSIFAIFKDNPKSGRDILFAGYCLYTYKCFMVYTFGNNIVYKDYILENPGIDLGEKILKIQEFKTNYCCINSKFMNTQGFLTEKLKNVKNFRWTGCMVSDVHRIIVNTGYFCYPGEKLRLLYECYPMAFLIENLGGVSNVIIKESTSGGLGEQILDLPFPEKNIHQKVGIFIDYKGELVSKI